MAERHTRGHPYHDWSVRAASMAGAILGFLFGIACIVWHGLMAQPSLMELLYPNWIWSTTNMLIAIIGLTVIGWIIGYVAALLYNWALKLQ